MLDMALNALKFFRNESCGKCVPCRMGSQKMVDIVTGWTRGKGSADDMPLIDELTDALKLTSICGLGQFAHAPLTSVLQHFREEVDAQTTIAPEPSIDPTAASDLKSSFTSTIEAGR